MWSFIERFAGAFWGMLYEMAPFLLIGVFAAGLVHESLGRFQKLRRFARKRSFFSLSFFNLSGLLLPICSCGTVPMAVGMRHQGVPLGSVFTFIFSAPATSIAAIILALAMLGPTFTLWYVAGAICCSYVIGAVFFLAEPKNGQIESRYLPGADNAPTAEKHGRGNFLLRALRWSTTVYGSRIAFDLIIGLLLVSLLVSTFSLQALAGWLDGLSFATAALVMITLAIPMYICSLPGIMLGATLVLSGVKPEYVWIFLMAGPVTNLGDLNVLRKSMGSGMTLLYAALVIGASISWGYLIHINLDWMDVWAYVRQYFAGQPGMAFGAGIESDQLWSQTSVLPMWPWLYRGSTLAVVGLVSHGAYQTVKEFFRNPCLHCTGFQADMRLNPWVCRQPCWKKNLFRRLKPGRTGHSPGPVIHKGCR